MSFAKIATLVSALTIGASGIASANIHDAQPDVSAKAPHGGIVNSAGAIALGTGFTVNHPATGEYIISYKAGSFKSCPAFVAAPAGYNGAVPIVDVYGYTCNSQGNGSLQVTVTIDSTSGASMDNAFQFTATPV